jgi:hypothetical protein
MKSYVVDYSRMKRVELPHVDDKFNLNHLCIALTALLFMYIYKRAKDKKYSQ